MKIICKCQQSLVVAYTAKDSGDFVFVVCREGLEKAIGRQLKVGEIFSVNAELTETDV